MWPSWVPDRATLQLGHRRHPGGRWRCALRDKRDLGIHTELFTDAVVDLVEAGALTGAAQGDQPRQDRVGLRHGDAASLSSSSHDNPMVEMRPVDYTNDTREIRRIRAWSAINSALEVDLSGQVVADSIGGRMYCGVGGQMDFIRGAALAEEGGRSSHCRRPRKVANLADRAILRQGAGVVTTRGHVRTVVTEWGVAELFGRSMAERGRWP